MNHEILDRALNGEILTGLDIVDCHCHMGPWFGYYFQEAMEDELVRHAELNGVSRLCVAPHASCSCDYRLGNIQLAEAMRKYPDQIYGLLVLSGSRPEEIIPEFDSYYSGKGFAGVKIYPSGTETSISDDNYFKVFSEVERRGGFVLTHTWEGSSYDSIELAEEAIRAFPKVPVIMAHCGGFPAGMDKSVRVANKYENAYVDTCGFEFSNVWIEDMVKIVDIRKVLFGSDTPFHDIRYPLSRILLADLDDDVKKLILNENYHEMVKFNPKV